MRRLAVLVASLALAPSAFAEEPLRVCADPNNLPFSDASGSGFENRIAAMIAGELHRPLVFVWRAQRRGFLREGLNAGECDLVTGVPTGLPMLLTTRPYYRSTYVFVTRPDEPRVFSLDDPVLRRWKVGVQLIGDDGMNSPPAHALAVRGIIDNVRGFPVYGDYRKNGPGAAIVRSVADRTIDVAAVWGPTAGYFSKQAAPPLEVTPFAVAFDHGLGFAFDISMGVRKLRPRSRRCGAGRDRHACAADRPNAQRLRRPAHRARTGTVAARRTETWSDQFPVRMENPMPWVKSVADAWAGTMDDA